MKRGESQFHAPSPRDATSSAHGMVERIPQVRVRGGDETIDLDHFIRERQLDTPRDADPKELVITSFVIPLRFREVEVYPETRKASFASPSTWRRQPSMHLLELLISSGIFLGLPMCLDREYDSESHKWGLVLLISGRFCTRKGWEFYAVIILHQVENGRYERAGIVILFYDSRTGELSHENSRTDWDMHLDE